MFKSPFELERRLHEVEKKLAQADATEQTLRQMMESQKSSQARIDAERIAWAEEKKVLEAIISSQQQKIVQMESIGQRLSAMLLELRERAGQPQSHEQSHGMDSRTSATTTSHRNHMTSSDREFAEAEMTIDAQKRRWRDLEHSQLSKRWVPESTHVTVPVPAPVAADATPVHKKQLSQRHRSALDAAELELRAEAVSKFSRTLAVAKQRSPPPKSSRPSPASPSTSSTVAIATPIKQSHDPLLEALDELLGRFGALSSRS